MSLYHYAHSERPSVHPPLQWWSVQQQHFVALYQVQQQMKTNNNEIRKIAKTVFVTYFHNFDIQVHSILNSAPMYCTSEA